MSLNPGSTSSEPDASTISPLLGTNRLQSAVDRMSAGANKLADGLTKAASTIQRLSTSAQQGFGTPGGIGNGATLSGGKPNGGGSMPINRPGMNQGSSTFLGMPSFQHQNQWGLGSPRSAPPPPPAPPSMWAQGGALAGGFIGAAMAGRLQSRAQEMIATNTTAQLMSRSTPSMGWTDIRSGIMRNNYTAKSDVDAMAGASFARQSGFSIGSSGWNSLMGAGKNYRVLDPTATFAEAQQRLSAPQSLASGNFLLTRGIRTTDGAGNARSQQAVVNDIIGKAGFSGTHRYTQDAYAKHWSATGNATMLINTLAQTDPNLAKAVEDQLRGSMQAQMHGGSRDAFTKAWSKGDWDSLERMGVKKTDLDRTLDKSALDRNIRDNMAGGFSDGLNAAVTALEQFKGALDGITNGPLGYLLGVPGGIGATSGMVGSSAMGGYLGAKIGGKFLGKAAANKGISGAAAGLAGKAGGAAKIGGKVLGKVGAPLTFAMSGFNTITSDDERSMRRAHYKDRGAYDWYATYASWRDTFANDLSFGLTDKTGITEGMGGSASTWDAATGGGSVGGTGGATSDSVMPVGDAKVSAPFGKYPNSGKPHYGVDFAVRAGTPVRAARGGVVYEAGWDKGGFGNHVRIDSGDGLYFIYGHLSKVNIRAGQRVKAGDLIGLSGSTGNSTGAHLHFEVRKGGKGRGYAVNPTPYLHGVIGPGSSSKDEGTGIVAKGRNALSAIGSALGMPWGVNEGDILAGAMSGASDTSVSRSGSSSDGDSGHGASTGTSGPTGPLTGILAKAGFKGNALSLAYAIMMAESHGNARAHNTNRATGDNSYGLFQINMLGGMGPERRARYNLPNNDALFDPYTNARVAYQMSKGGTNWTPWSTYKSGSYKKYLGGQVKSYDVGSTNIDVDQIARVHKGEMIIDPVTADELRKALSSNSPTSVFGSGKGGRGIHVEKIEIHTAHPYTDSAATDLAKQFLAVVNNHEQLMALQEG